MTITDSQFIYVNMNWLHSSTHEFTPVGAISSHDCTQMHIITAPSWSVCWQIHKQRLIYQILVTHMM